MTTVGIYVYKIDLIDSQTHTIVPMASSGAGGELLDFMPIFINLKSSLTKNSAIGRSWNLENNVNNGSVFEGIIKYGTFGHSSEIIDPASGVPLFSRADHHVEQIPLYYQYFIQPGKKYAICAVQSYRTWSCVSIVNSDLNYEFRNHTNGRMYLVFRKLMPSELLLYGNLPVKTITLRRKSVTRDKFDALRGINATEVDVEMSFSAKRKGTLGRLTDVANQIKRNSANNLLLESDLEFPEVTAQVRVGSTLRKVGVIGPSVNAGVIDVSSDLKYHNGHPTFQSISHVASGIIADFAKILG